ncbi:MAG: FlgD immunoglobulin-like domain containing protein, partial [Candidatus Cloacimonas sp.]|jgi:hypothetical protein|nr:FlgD immunoglobulin-like domain containing protein [Candidatus Cloacimonas sp.]
MLSDTPAQNDLPIPATGTPTITFPNTGATVAFTTSTAATNLTAIRVNTNPGGALPNGILSLANRHWTINSTATSGLGEYDLTLNLTGLANITDISLARLVKREHVLAAWTDLGTPTTFDSGLHTATWHITNGFSDFGIGGDMETTLPVELSLFTAILTAQNKVKLSWVSQSETGLSGYYVYRSISNQLSTAQMISPLIQGTNSSEQHTYQFTDSELFEEGIYYYWLQSYNMDGSSEYYGYVLVNYSLTNNNDIPEIPIVTGLNCIFPNPFNPVTFIAYSLKESSSVTFNIYNSRGQLVRKIDNAPTEEGLHRVQWDGRDNAGKSCSSGLYVIRMLAGKQTFIHKAILMK